VQAVEGATGHEDLTEALRNALPVCTAVKIAYTTAVYPVESPTENLDIKLIPIANYRL